MIHSTLTFCDLARPDLNYAKYLTWHFLASRNRVPKLNGIFM